MTALPEICERLRSMYAEKYGRDRVELIKDSAKVSGCRRDGIELIKVSGWVQEVETGWNSSRTQPRLVGAGGTG